MRCRSVKPQTGELQSEINLIDLPSADSPTDAKSTETADERRNLQGSLVTSYRSSSGDKLMAYSEASRGKPHQRVGSQTSLSASRHLTLTVL